jgi:peptidoglycan/LPS O-acetylase OafA/YrhL
MPLLSAWYPVITVALCLALAGAIVRHDRWYSNHLGRAGAGQVRFETIDGLRGFLALGVFFVHVMATYGYYAEGRWYTTFAPVHLAMGQAGVSVFFMITGFLFWRRVLRSEPALDTKALYVSRIRRLVPMYLFSVAIVVLVVLAMTGFTLHEPLLAFMKEVRAWLSFGVMETQDFNGVRDAHIINAVYWTLAYEWGFYLALPLLALFARGPAFALLAALIIFFGIRTPITLNFLGGMLAALAVERHVLQGKLAKWWLAPLPLAALAAVLMWRGGEVYGPLPIALLFVFFVFVVDGNSLFGLLRTRAAKMLGTVSYSFYLLHGIVLFVFFHSVNAWLPVAQMTPEQHWIVAIAAALTATVASALTYRWVEYPFIAPAGAPAGPALDRALRRTSPVS